MYARLRLILLATFCACGACSKPQPAMDGPDDARDHARLTRTKLTHNRELQAEIARLEAERATPLLLHGKGKLDGEGNSGSAQPSQLETIFPPRTRDSLRRRIDGIWPAEQFELKPTTRSAAAELLSKNASPLERFQRLIAQPNFSFTVDHSLGLMADTSYIDAVHIGSRLVGLSASAELDGNRLDAAIARLKSMFRAAELLSREKSVAARAAAAYRRRDALQVLEAIARHADATTATHRALHQLLSTQLARWPADEEAWIGDRALGLHTYELIRDGYLLSLLTQQEVGVFNGQVGLDELAALVGENIDRDELFYLQAMREYITACQHPFYERTALFQQIEQDIEVLRASEAYPFVADQLLLVQIQETQRLQAKDRARCEAWLFALELSLGMTPEDTRINPLTGSPFVVEITPEQIVVDGIDKSGPERAATIPQRAVTAMKMRFRG